MKYAVTGEVDIEDLAVQIAYDIDVAIKLIKAIDLSIADAEFTEQMATFFCGETCKEFGNDPTFDAQKMLPEQFRK